MGTEISDQLVFHESLYDSAGNTRNTVHLEIFRRDVLAILPDVEMQLLHLEEKHRSYSELRYLWRMVTLMQDLENRKLYDPQTSRRLRIVQRYEIGIEANEEQYYALGMKSKIDELNREIIRISQKHADTVHMLENNHREDLNIIRKECLRQNGQRQYELEDENQRLLDKQKVLCDDLDSAKLTISKIAKSKTKLQEEVELLRYKNNDLTSSLTHEQNRFDTEYNELLHLLKTQREENVRVQTQQKQLSDELQDKVKLLLREKDTFTEDLRRRDDKISKLEDNNHKLLNECEHLRRKTERLAVNLEQKNAEMMDKEHTREQNLLIKSNNVKSDLQSTEETERKLRKENSELNIKLQVQTQLNDDLKREREIENRKVSYENSRKLEQNNKLQSEVNKLNLEIKYLNEELLQEKKNAEIQKREIYKMQRLVEEINEGKTNLKVKNEIQNDSELHNKVQQLIQDKMMLTEDLRQERDKVKGINNFGQQERNYKLQMETEQLHGKIKGLNEELKNKEIHIQKLLIQTNEEKAKLKQAEALQTHFEEKQSELQNQVHQLRLEKTILTNDLRKERDTERNNESILILQEKNYKLQKEVDQLRHENLRSADVRDKHVNDRNFELESKVQQLLQEKEKLTKELLHENQIVKKAEQKIKEVLELQDKNQELEKRVSQLQYQKQRLEDDLIQEKKTVKKMDEEYKSLRKQTEKLEHEIVSLKTKLTEASFQKSSADSRKIINSDQDVQNQLKETKNQLKQVQAELNDTKSRLSRAMGDRLTDNNPNIADLSDRNRPTKISERYQELYDNQWTDAFEKVNATCKNEENTINVLRIILMDALDFCKTQDGNQMFQIKASFLKGEELPANMNKQVKECRKAMAELYGKGLYREYCEHLRKSKSEKTAMAMSVLSYVKECFEICWLMVVQDPPVVFGTEIGRGDTFNKDHYKAYTKSGERVDFVVWPVLLLHQNGPVLCKGVAQGK